MFTKVKAFFTPSPTVRKVWRFVRPILVIAISVAITYGAFSFAFQYITDKYINPVNINDPTPITVVIENSDSASRIATKLYNACGDGEGVISNTAVFKIYVDFLGKSKKLKSGTYILSKNMDIPQIVDIICEGNPPKTSVKFTVQEGYTISGVLYVLDKAGLEIDEDEFLRLCNDKELFSKYPFISEIKDSGGKKKDYLLEGYLFPDTYEAFIDAKPETIINRMLLRFNEIFTDVYMQRAQELGMTIDEVITLASLIEREASMTDDFPRVSAVFHNRLADGEKLESCASLQYVLKVNKYVYNEQERATDSPYNTYRYEGLPAGPISNPGKLAIEAALYPDVEYLDKGYKFFCNMDLPDNKYLVFARTYDEHQKNIEKYQQYWN